MNKVNYQKLGQQQIANLPKKANLLLHCCCAPCASACLQYLKDYFNVTVLFYNPNIEKDEYERRKQELQRFVTQTGWANWCECPHDEEVFLRAAQGLESCPEGGARCAKCFALRLQYTATTAKNLGFDFIATTLTISPLKDAALLNAVGKTAAEQAGVTWLFSDFKKQNGYLNSIALSKRYDLYRQNYCGCSYSRQQNTLTT